MRGAAPVLLALALAAGGCSTMEITTDYEHTRDFSVYHSFTFRQSAPPRNAQARRSAEYAIGMALEKKGLKQADDGDLSIYGHFVVDREVRFDTWGYSTAGWYGYQWSGATVTTATVIPVGTIVIDLVDQKTQALVWRGVVKDQLSDELEPEEREKKAIRVAQELFAGFPPKPKK